MEYIKQRNDLNDKLLKIYCDNFEDSRQIELIELFLKEDETVIETIKAINVLYEKYISFQREVLETAKDIIYNMILSTFKFVEDISGQEENNIPHKRQIAMSILSGQNITLSDEVYTKLFSLTNEKRMSFLRNNIFFDTIRLEKIFREFFRGDLECEQLAKKDMTINSPYAQYSLEYGILSQFIWKPIIELNHPLYILPPEYSKTINLYKKYDYDLLKEERQFRYGLIEIDETKQRYLFESYPRILDKKYNISIDLIGIGQNIYQFLRTLRQKYKFTLSLRPHLLYCYDSIYELVPILEAKRRGEYFNPEDFYGKLVVSQLYNFEGDNLWVQISGNEITFEEVIYDYLTYDKEVFTQVVHLEVFNRNEQNYISHIDHEYIVYDGDTFIERQERIVKGKRKVKTFKINDGEIPFDISNILMPIILMFFHKDELIKEYFQGSIKQ